MIPTLKFSLFYVFFFISSANTLLPFEEAQRNGHSNFRFLCDINFEGQLHCCHLKWLKETDTLIAVLL